MKCSKTNLGDLVEITSGFAFKSNLFNESKKGLPLIRIRDVLPGFSETYYDGEYEEKYLINNGDALIGMDGNFNLAIWNGGKSLLNQRVCKIKSNNEKLDQRYLLNFLPITLKKIEDATPFVTVKHLSVKDIREIVIPLPPIEEQRRIAAILDKAEALKAKRREAIAKLDQLLQSVFLEMFGDPVTNNKNWREDKLLGDVADICSGITKGRKTTSETKLIPYLAVANVQDKFLKVDVVKEIEATEDEIEKYKLKKHDLLLTEGGDPDKLGRGSLWHDEIPLCIHQNHVFRVRLNNKEINPIYLNWLVGSYRGKRYFLSVAKQTTGIASINLGQLKKFPLLIPPLDLQEKFAKIEEAVRKKYMLEQKISLEKIDALIGSIQASYF